MKWIIATCILLCLVGCNQASNTSKQVLKINFHTDPPTLDPRKGGDLTSSMMHYLLFEGLTRLTPDGPTEPAIAKQIAISEDQLTYTFYLRDCAWSDGNALTAYDIEYSWKKMLDPNFACFNAHLLYPIVNAREAKQGQALPDTVGIQAVDAHTLIVKLHHPTPYFLELTAFPALYPVSRHTDHTDKNWAEGPPHPFACNGPFRLVKWQHGNKIKLERNPHYWDQDKVHLDGVKVTLIDNAQTALQLFEKGQLDILGAAYTTIPTDAITKFKVKGQLHTYPVAGTSACTFNLQKKLLSNRKVRQALSAAIDRNAIVQNITVLNEDPAYSALHPTLAFWDQADYTIQADPKDLFEEGLSELQLSLDAVKPLRLVYANSDLNHQVAQTLQEQWKKTLGLDIQLEACESKVYFSQLIHRNYDIGIFLMRAQYHDPMNILERFQHLENQKNYPGWHNEDFIKLLDTQMYAKTTQARAEMLEKAQAILMHEVPIAPIFHSRIAFMHQPHVKDIYISPRGQIVLHWAKKMDEKRSAA